MKFFLKNRARHITSLTTMGAALWTLLGFVACSNPDDTAGITSETGEIVASLENGQLGGRVSFTKRLGESGFADTATVVDVNSQGEFKAELEADEYYFVEYSDDRHASWSDSIFVKKDKADSIKLNMATYAWDLQGQIPLSELPEADQYEIGFKNTPYFSKLDSEGNFNLDMALEDHELGVRFLKDQEVQWIKVEGWSSDWFGVVDLKDVAYVDGKLVVNICSSRNPTIMLHSNKSQENYESKWNLCEDQVESDVSMFQDQMISQSGDLVINHDEQMVYEYMSATANFEIVSEISSASMLNVYSIAENEYGVAAVKYLPSSNTLVAARSRDSLNSGFYTQEVDLDSDSTLDIQFWGEEIILWNEEGLVQIRQQVDMSKVLYDIDLGAMLDMVRLSADYILVLRNNQTVESIQLSTGEVITQKTIDNLGELYDLGFLESE